MVRYGAFQIGVSCSRLICDAPCVSIATCSVRRRGGLPGRRSAKLLDNVKLENAPVLLSGSVISRNDEAIHLSFEGAHFLLTWGYSVSGEPETIINSAQNVLNFVLLNCNSSAGISYMFEAGSFDGRSAELRLFVHGIGNQTQGVARLVSYTLAYSKGASS